MSNGNQLITITEFKTGFDTYNEPENMPDDAFPLLDNANVFRGVVRKRRGYTLLGVLCVPISDISQANPAVATTSVDHGLLDGDVINISGVVGMTEVNLGADPELNPFTVDNVTATTFELVGIDSTSFTEYDSGGCVLMPVQGLHTRQTTGFLKDLVAFTPRLTFLFNTATDVFDNISGTTSWTGTLTDFFWPLNYQRSFWITNNIDPIRYTYTTPVWEDFTPDIDPSTTLQTALMIFPYKDRMVALSTTEGGMEFRQRVRYSQNGTAYVISDVPAGEAFDVDSWRQDIPGKGGFRDAPTDQAIITAGFVRDILVVVFEFSAWKLRYTGNDSFPFVWERLHSQLGAESTYSVVGFDDGILSVGRAGITLSDTNQQKRIDQIIPDQVFDINNENNAQKRVHGIRDYQRQFVYWTYPSTNELEFPDKVLVYNYVERTWSTYTLSFTTFGEFRRVEALIWEDADQEWQTENSFWASGGLGDGFPEIVAGDQFSNVFRLLPEITADDGEGFNFNILTKKFNPWIDKGLQSKAVYMYLLISGTGEEGEITIQHFIDEAQTPTPIASYTVSTATNGQQKVWRRIALSGATSQYHQFLFTLTDEQLANQNISTVDVEIYKIILEMAPSGRLNYGITNV